MLTVNNLTFSYRRKAAPVLDDFSLSIERGGVYGLLGPNGAGKSTLLYLIAGLLTPKHGNVLYNGTDTRRRLPSTLRDMFIVPEEFDLPHIKLERYIKLNAPFYPNFSMDDIRRHLDTFDMPADINLGELSMGQKKKAFMSFALACNTPLLLMDEPTNGLDIPGKSRFRKFIAQSMTDDRSIIISTHQVRDIDRILDHVIIMDNHKVLFNRTVGEITERLAFLSTDDRDTISRALYAQPAIGGTNIILPNPGDIETEMNLETLFELALSSPTVLNESFNNPSSNTPS